MNPEIIPQFCEDASPVFFNLFDFSIAPPFLYYAYIPIVILLLTFSGYILISDHFSRKSKLLTGISLSLAAATSLTLLQWIAAPVSEVMFAWQLWNIANISIFIFTALFVSAYILSERHYLITKICATLSILPVLILTPTKLNISGFDFANCEGIIGPLFKYSYAMDLVALFFVLLLTIGLLLKRKVEQKNLKLIVAISSLLLLTLFLSTTYIADVTGDYRLEMIGTLGGVLFLIGISYLSVKYNAFNMKMLATEMLVGGLIIVIASMLFIRTIEALKFIVSGSLFLTTILGYLLVRSVRREVKQRKEIERLAKNLEHANKRLKILDQMKSEFVSIASHQLRSPLTSIRGYASMLLEGSYGHLPDKAREAVEKISESSRFMSLSVEDYLNVSRIQSGNMKYENSDFNFQELVFNLVDDLRQGAMRRGLVLKAKSDLNSKAIVNADIGKTRQVVQNLIDNSIKYTPKGSILVTVRDSKKPKQIFVDITDTGIGMSEEVLEAVFNKFERAQNANEVNVTGTGLGLYIARRIAEDMGGKVTATSAGEGKGATFTLMLPLQM